MCHEGPSFRPKASSDFPLTFKVSSVTFSIHILYGVKGGKLYLIRISKKLKITYLNFPNCRVRERNFPLIFQEEVVFSMCSHCCTFQQLSQNDHYWLFTCLYLPLNHTFLEYRTVDSVSLEHRPLTRTQRTLLTKWIYDFLLLIPGVVTNIFF